MHSSLLGVHEWAALGALNIIYVTYLGVFEAFSSNLNSDLVMGIFTTSTNYRWTRHVLLLQTRAVNAARKRLAKTN